MQVMSVGICGPGAASIKGRPRVGLGGGLGGGPEVGGSEGRGEGQGPPAAPPESTPFGVAVQMSPSSSWCCGLVPEAGPWGLCLPWLHWAGLGVDTLLFLLVHPRQGWNFPVELFTRQLKGKTKATT